MSGRQQVRWAISLALHTLETAEAFRGERWMKVELTGPEVAVSEPNVIAYFIGDAETIQRTPVLEHGEWLELVQKVVGGPTQIRENVDAVNYAAAKLRDGFAAEMWQAAKDAWKSNELAWPALNLRLLGLLLSQVGGVAEQVVGLREQISELRTAIGSAANAAASTAPVVYKEMLKEAICEYQDDLNASLDRNFQRVLDGIAEVKAALVRPRTVRWSR